MLRDVLPKHSPLSYSPVNECVYCGAKSDLTDEHVVPLGLGGRHVLPLSSCRACAAQTSAFEGTCLRTMFGPLRMLYDMPSRRKSERPETMPLKVKRGATDEWTFIEVPRSKYPFLVLFPIFPPPTRLTHALTEEQGATAKKFWIRGASESEGFQDHLELLCQELDVHAVMPTAEARVEEFCQMVAKIAHSHASAVIGVTNFTSELTPMIRTRDFSSRSQLIGTLAKEARASSALHELELVHGPGRLVSVRLRLLAVMGTPTYLIHVGETL